MATSTNRSEEVTPLLEDVGEDNESNLLENNLYRNPRDQVSALFDKEFGKYKRISDAGNKFPFNPALHNNIRPTHTVSVAELESGSAEIEVENISDQRRNVQQDSVIAIFVVAFDTRSGSYSDLVL